MLSCGHTVYQRQDLELELRSPATCSLPAALTGWSVQKGSASPALRGRRCSGASTASPGGSSPILWAGSLCASSCLPGRGGLRPHPDHCLTWCLGARWTLGKPGTSDRGDGDIITMHSLLPFPCLQTHHYSLGHRNGGIVNQSLRPYLCLGNLEGMSLRCLDFMHSVEDY